MADQSLQMAPHDSPEIAHFVTIVSDLERDRASITDKILAAYDVLAGSQLPRGRQPYQNFADLVRIRNQVVHWKDEPISFVAPNDVVRPPKALRRLTVALQPTGSTAQPWQIAPPLAWWLSRVEVSKWACNAAAAIVQAILQAFPLTDRAGGPSVTRAQLIQIFGRHFQLRA